MSFHNCQKSLNIYLSPLVGILFPLISVERKQVGLRRILQRANRKTAQEIGDENRGPADPQWVDLHREQRFDQKWTHKNASKKWGLYGWVTLKMGAAENLVLMAQPSWVKGNELGMQPLGLEEVLC